MPSPHKKKLLLLNPPPNADMRSQLYLESLGLGYLATAVRRELGRTHEVALWDCAILDPEMKFVPELLESCKPDYLGLSLSSMNAHEGVRLAETLRRVRPEAKIIVGGILATSVSDAELAAYRPDAIIRGEGEGLIGRALEMLDSGVQAGPVSLTQDTPLDVNALGWVARDMLPWQLRLHPQASLSASRGCPYRCGFCSIPQPGARRLWRPRDIEDVVEEMVYLNRDYQVSHFYFVDDNFLLNTRAGAERAERFAGLVLDRLPPVRFGFMCRSAAIERPLFKLLKRSGLSGVFLGIESFSQRVLDRYAKKEAVEEHIRAIATLNDLDITINPGFIFFDPWSSPQEMSETLNQMLRLDFPVLQSVNSKLTCYKGADIEKSLEELRVGETRLGIQKYVFQDATVDELFKECRDLFYADLPGIPEYVDYQTYNYVFGYVHPYFMNTEYEYFFRKYFAECRKSWRLGDNTIMQWLLDRLHPEHDRDRDLKALLRERAAPLWARGNATAERFLRLAFANLTKNLAREDADAARVSLLAFTSPSSELSIDALFGTFATLPPEKRALLAELMSSYKGANATACFSLLMRDKDDAVASAAIRSALTQIHVPILDRIKEYLDWFGERVTPELAREITRAREAFRLSYPEFVLASRSAWAPPQ